MVGFILLLAGILIAFIRSTVASAGSSSLEGSMKKIFLNFLQLEALALGFRLEWPEIVRTVFMGMGLTSSANPSVFVIECILPTSYLKVLPSVYQNAIIVAVLPIAFMLGCGLGWYIHDHCFKYKVKPHDHSTVPHELYVKHMEHNAKKVEALKLKKKLKKMENDLELKDPRLNLIEGSLDNDTEKDFGFLLRRAIEKARKQGIDPEESFIFFSMLVTPDEVKADNVTAGIDEEDTTRAETAPPSERTMSTAAFEHMLSEWNFKVASDAQLWSMLERVDSDGSGNISVKELKAFVRSTMDRWILSATVVAYMFYPTCWVIGLPVAMFFVLKLHTKDQHNDIMRFRFGMLMEGYEDEYFYWESVIASRKALVMMISVFMATLPVDVQAYVGIAVVMFYMSLHIMWRPYNHKLLDQMEMYALVTSFVTLYAGILMYIVTSNYSDAGDPSSSMEQNTLTFFGVSVTTIIVTLNFVYIVYAIWEIVYQSLLHAKGPLKRVVLCLHKCCSPCRSAEAKALHALRHSSGKESSRISASKVAPQKAKNSTELKLDLGVADASARDLKKLRNWTGDSDSEGESKSK
eukprot:g5313.t1